MDSDSDANMSGSDSTYQLDSDCDTFIATKSVVLSTGDPSVRDANYPTKRAVGFQSVVDAVMVGELDNNDNDQQMSDF